MPNFENPTKKWDWLTRDYERSLLARFGEKNRDWHQTRVLTTLFSLFLFSFSRFPQLRFSLPTILSTFFFSFLFRYASCSVFRRHSQISTHFSSFFSFFLKSLNCHINPTPTLQIFLLEKCPFAFAPFFSCPLFLFHAMLLHAPYSSRPSPYNFN